jgi:type IV secretory pathway VirB3-like protein
MNAPETVSWRTPVAAPALRSSVFHRALHRPRLVMGIEKGAFGALVMAAVCLLVFRLYWALLLLPPGWVIARWLSKKDDQFVLVLGSFLREDHVFDATPRSQDVQGRPSGWGRGLWS